MTLLLPFGPLQCNIAQVSFLSGPVDIVDRLGLIHWWILLVVGQAGSRVLLVSNPGLLATAAFAAAFAASRLPYLRTGPLSWCGDGDRGELGLLAGARTSFGVITVIIVIVIIVIIMRTLFAPAWIIWGSTAAARSSSSP